MLAVKIHCWLQEQSLQSAPELEAKIPAQIWPGLERIACCGFRSHRESAGSLQPAARSPLTVDPCSLKDDRGANVTQRGQMLQE